MVFRVKVAQDLRLLKRNRPLLASPQSLLAISRFVSHRSAAQPVRVAPPFRQENEQALRNGGRLFSVYEATTGQKFYVITESAGTATNVELHISRLMLSLQKC